MALANSKVWEARLVTMEATKNEYRDNAKHLAVENDLLSGRMHQTELDTIDIITFLKKQDQSKDDAMEKMDNEMRNLRRQARQEKQTLIDDYNAQMAQLEKQLQLKTDDLALMQSELQHVKEFRRKRAQMQKELDDIRDAAFLADRAHKEEMSKAEHRFLEEKAMLQKEASQKIAELAERAHHEAISNLDETTRSVYKENVRLSEALSHHIREGDLLRKQNKSLKEESEILAAEKESTTAAMQDKVMECKRQKLKIAELESKVEVLEKALSHMVQEFDTERAALTEKAAVENESSRNEIAKLKKIVDMKTQEMAKIKKLARNILMQRTDIETFFLESINQVRKEITDSQQQYKKAAESAYQRKMADAYRGQGDYPKVRTFHKSDTSTNSVFDDLQAAEMLSGPNSSVDISELTWEQKERVLRYLFARMNGSRRPVKSSPVTGAQLPLTVGGRPAARAIAWGVTADPRCDDDSGEVIAGAAATTFLTEGGANDGMLLSQADQLMRASLSKLPVLPDIGHHGSGHEPQPRQEEVVQ